MERYIKEEACAKAIRDKFNTPLGLVLSILSNVPTTDVVEVKRGRWIKQRTLSGEIATCSECKTLGSPSWKCCPVCTADMRGERIESYRMQI